MQGIICQAIWARRVILFEYNGLKRIVEPYQLGYRANSTDPELSGYQIEGESQTGGLPAWRSFKMDAIRNLTVSDQGFGIRLSGGYRVVPNKIITSVICEA